MSKLPQIAQRRMPPAEVAVDVFGGIRPVARILNVAPSTVMRWLRGSGGVPSEHIKTLLDAATRASKRLTVEELALGRIGISRQLVTFGSHKASPKPEPIGALGAMARALTRAR